MKQKIIIKYCRQIQSVIRVERAWFQTGSDADTLIGAVIWLQACSDGALVFQGGLTAHRVCISPLVCSHFQGAAPFVAAVRLELRARQ